MTWSPAQYTRFEDDRTRPVRDLVAAIPNAAAARATDIGCGPGNSTEVLAARYPDARVQGIDSSPEMIEAARARLPGTRFDVADISGWTPEQPQDVMLANAVLQWVPDHAALFPRLVGGLAPGGSLAVQMPDNMDEPASALMRSVAEAGPWAATLEQARTARRARMMSWDGYYRMLRPLCSRLDVWRTTYVHLLPGGPDDVVEWFKGSGLRPFVQPLPAGMREDYLAAYRAAVAEAYPILDDGSVLLPFPRLFLLATR
jgi:trans-aconitate 2-methyltransferase